MPPIRTTLRMKALTPAIALLAIAGSALAQDEGPQEAAATDLDALVEAYFETWDEMRETGSPSYEDWIALHEETLAKVDLETMEADELATLYAAGLFNGDEARETATARVAELLGEVEADSVDEVRLLTLDLFLRGIATRTNRPTPQAQSEALGAVLDHPKLHDAVKQGRASSIGRAIMATGPQNMQAHKDGIVALGVMLADGSPDMGLDGAIYWSAMDRMPDLDDEQREAIRVGLVQLLRRSVEATDADGEPVLGETLAYVRNTLGRMDGAAIRGQLIDHPVPEMTITWSSDESLTTFEDLQGKVVVVDFWATWCQPCIASFPKLRELLDYYEGKPVTIVGVTSLQGAVYGLPDQDGPVDCEGDPQKEHGLMPAVMETHNMTWPVVFTEQDVFNPDFNVSGIPHLAIIDSTGTVRHNNLNPTMSVKDMVEIIDPLLVAMGVEPPMPENASPSASQNKAPADNKPDGNKQGANKQGG